MPRRDAQSSRTSVEHWKWVVEGWGGTWETQSIDVSRTFVRNRQQTAVVVVVVFIPRLSGIRRRELTAIAWILWWREICQRTATPQTVTHRTTTTTTPRETAKKSASLTAAASSCKHSHPEQQNQPSRLTPAAVAQPPPPIVYHACFQSPACFYEHAQRADALCYVYIHRP